MSIFTYAEKLYAKIIRNRLQAGYIRKKYRLDEKNYFSGPEDACHKIAIASIFKGEDQYLKNG